MRLPARSTGRISHLRCNSVSCYPLKYLQYDSDSDRLGSSPRESFELYWIVSYFAGSLKVLTELTLTMYLLQNWFNLSDEGVEDAIYDSYCMRTFYGTGLHDRIRA